jgi:hypothetical protein
LHPVYLPVVLAGWLGLSDAGLFRRLVARVCQNGGLRANSAGRLVIEPARPKRLTMAELLVGFTPEDKPGELDWGKPVGNEAW